MHPASTLLLVLGYLLAVPIAARFGSVAARQNRPALTGHQLGVMIAGAGWAVRGSLALVVAHIAWLVIARLWFFIAKPEEAAQ